MTVDFAIERCVELTRAASRSRLSLITSACTSTRRAPLDDSTLSFVRGGTPRVRADFTSSQFSIPAPRCSSSLSLCGFASRRYLPGIWTLGKLLELALKGRTPRNDQMDGSHAASGALIKSSYFRNMKRSEGAALSAQRRWASISASYCASVQRICSKSIRSDVLRSRRTQSESEQSHTPVLSARCNEKYLCELSRRSRMMRKSCARTQFASSTSCPKSTPPWPGNHLIPAALYLYLQEL